MRLSSSAPGRVCLFGEHQDYLGLPVIPCAVSMRCTVTGSTVQNGEFRIVDVTTGQRCLFESGDLHLRGDDFDYLRAVVSVMVGEGRRPGGADVKIRNQVPIESGLSSSAAFLVSWAGFLNWGFDLGYDPVELAMVCYRAEREMMGIPCGMMDQISSSLGGLVMIECREPPEVEPLPAILPGLVIGDTGVHKRTIDVHRVRTAEMGRALMELEESAGHTIDLSTIGWEEIEDHLESLNDIGRRRVRATLKNRDITRRARGILERENPELGEIGDLLNLHQAYLRDDYEVSHPMIETLLNAGLDAGAIGGKLTGAGLGGCVILLAPGREAEVADAIAGKGGKPYVVSVDDGLRREPNA